MSTYDILRPYQREAYDACVAMINSGEKRGLVALPTGSGKSKIISAIAEGCHNAFPKIPVAIMANRIKIKEQLHEEIKDLDNSLAVITSPQELRFKKLYNARILIIDECHHYSTNQYSSIVNEVNAEYVLGFTATPQRADGLWATKTFGRIIYALPSITLIEQGYLSDFYDRPIVAKFTIDAVLKMMPHLDYLHNRIIIFARNIGESNALAELLTRAGYPTYSVTSKHSKDARVHALRSFDHGDVHCISNVDVLTEGYDCPDANIAILCGQTGSNVKMGQSVGRILRPAEGKIAYIFRFVKPWSDKLPIRPMDGMTGPTITGLAKAMELGMSAREAIHARYGTPGGASRRSDDQEWFAQWLQQSCSTQ